MALAQVGNYTCIQVKCVLANGETITKSGSSDGCDGWTGRREKTEVKDKSNLAAPFFLLSKTSCRLPRITTDCTVAPLF